SFPKIDSLQKKFGNKIQILSVTDEDKAMVTEFMEKMKAIKDLQITTVANDKVLRLFFPHVVVPHCVWINAEGKVIAITDGDSVSEKNISAMLEGKLTKLPVKKDKENVVFENNGYPSFMPAYRVKEDDQVSIKRMDSASLLMQSVLTGY